MSKWKRPRRDEMLTFCNRNVNARLAVRSYLLTHAGKKQQKRVKPDQAR